MLYPKEYFTGKNGIPYTLRSPELVQAMAQTVLGDEAGTRFRYSLCHDVLGECMHKYRGVPKDLKRPAQPYRFDEDRKVVSARMENLYQLTEANESGSRSHLGKCGWDGAAYFQHVHETGYAFQRRLRNALYQDVQEKLTV